MRLLAIARASAKWTLATLGAWLLVGLYLERWGVWATIWLLGFPFVVGGWRTLARRSRAATDA